VVEQPIELRLVESTDGQGTCSHSRVLLVAGASSRVQLVERQQSSTTEPALSNLTTEIVLEHGARVEHCRWVDHGTQTWSVARTVVVVGEAAEYRSWSISGRGRFVRHDLSVHLAGRGAKAILDGLSYGRSGELVDQHVRVWHEQPEGQTKENYRAIIEDGGQGIFDGIIYVGRGAVQTDARQENRNLLLGPRSIVHTKPHLEIDADDVNCSHGATVGQLDEEQVFYLRSRGVAEAEARAVLAWAFAKEIIDRCPNDSMRSEVAQLLQNIGAAEVS
jgi:Fe-S cluster assembly protein SufD